MGMEFRRFYNLLELVTDPVTPQELSPEQAGNVIQTAIQNTFAKLPDVKMEQKASSKEIIFDLKTPSRIIQMTLEKENGILDIQFNWSSAYRNNNYDNFSGKDSKVFFPIQKELQADTPMFLSTFKAFLAELRKYPIYIQYETISSPFNYKRSNRRATLYDKILSSTGYTLNGNTKPTLAGTDFLIGKSIWTPPVLNHHLSHATSAVVSPSA